MPSENPSKLKKHHLPQKEYQRRYQQLLKLLFQIAHEPASGFVDLTLRSKFGSSLKELMKRSRIHEWKKIGQCHHLLALHNNPPEQIAFVVQEKPNKFLWHIVGRHSIVGTESSLERAKQKVASFFEVIESTE